TKVVFVPGFGASWNANAILNCQFDSDPSHWSLASYAETTYNPILNAIATSGWNTKPFYYDWRQEVPVNAVSLTNTINGFAEPNEKIDLIGHSMGGLVSRAYLETQSGEKLDSLLTIGSPHKGLSVSYPSWSGGEIWSDNFLAKVATTLLLKRCGGIFSNNRTTVQNLIPSVHNLLPTFNYLHIMKTGILKSTSSMFAKNNWLPTDFPFFGVRVGSLSGVGFSTLINIPVKPPSVRDLLAGNWLDGNPTGKEYSLNGDGTTLAESSIVAGAENKIINQTHAGLVNSVEGMTEILKFLGTPQQAAILNTNQVEPNSALVIIGYPSNFWVSDEKGNFKKDKDGMVAFINPKSGNFRLNLLPQTNKTLFIVAQFLPNGQVFYKEYNLTNLLPKSKTLEFNQDDPQEDILN
ncbi:MAG TPA: hypothetical protein VKC54_02545, partial [Patescibacteria group bacterium]|nr:hypothetical protein [Patescibacteria group bacterium]